MKVKGYQACFVGVMVFMLAVAPRAMAGDWTVTRVVDGMVVGKVGPEALATKPNGTPSIAFSGDKLYYSSYDGTAWSPLQVVDESYRNGIASLALNAVGFPIIAYFSSGSELKIAYQHLAFPGPGVSWSVETVGPAKDGLNHAPSIAIDHSGFPHVAYRTPEGHLGYAYKDASGWHTETVDSNLLTLAETPSLVLTTDDQPRIGYTARESYSSDTDLARYAARTCNAQGACSWQIEAIEDGVVWFGAATGAVRLEIDALDQPHAFWVLQGAGGNIFEVHHYVRPAEGWMNTHQQVASSYKTELVVAQDSTGGFHQAWINVLEGEVMYRDPTGKTFQVVGNFTHPESISLTLSANDEPILCVFDNDTGSDSAPESLRILALQGTSWVEETLATDSGSITFDLDLDSNGHPHLAYAESSQRTLKLAGYDGTNWTHQLVNSNVALGRPSLSIGPTDLPNMAYIDQDTKGLMFQRYRCGGICVWLVPEEVDATGISEVKLEVDASDHPHLAYRRYKELNYASHNGFTWQYANVVSETIVEYLALVVPAGGTARMAYYENYSHLMLAARICNPFCVWTTSGPVNTDPYNTEVLKFQLDATGNSHVAAVDEGLDYFWLERGTWMRRRITDDVTSLLGRHIDFKLGPSDQPFFVFAAREGTADGDLKYATRYGNNPLFYWDEETILPNAYARDVVLAVTHFGQPYVAFRQRNNDLMIAVKDITIPDLRMTKLTHVPGGQIQLHWAGLYENIRVYRSPTLAPTAWALVAGPLSGDQTTVVAPSAKSVYKVTAAP